MANKRNHDSIWDVCREARDADASRKARDAVRLKSAALGLKCGFVQSGTRWVQQCPSCKRLVELLIKPNGEVCAVSDNGMCDAVPRIQQLLCDEGFQ